MQVLGLPTPELLPLSLLARHHLVLAVGDSKERQTGRAPERVGRDEAYLESLPDRDNVPLAVSQREDVVGDMITHRTALIYFGREKPVGEDYPGSGTLYCDVDRLTAAVQRDEAPGRIVADIERQAPEVARPDFSCGVRAESVQVRRSGVG